MSPLIAVIILLLFVVIGYLLIQMRKMDRMIKKNEGDIQVYKKSAINIPNIETVETVLNPHLFKNILNTVQSHAYQTYQALDKLANVLDYILYESRKSYVTPREEIEFAKSLIDINRIKLSPLFELSVKKRIDESCSMYEKKILLPLISIDLIENAFKHADLQSPNAYISIVFEFKNNIFSLIVSNRISSKRPFVKEKGGIGSTTFEQRLNHFYQGKYSLERIVDDEAFIAHLKIDLNEPENKMHNS